LFPRMVGRRGLPRTRVWRAGHTLAAAVALPLLVAGTALGDTVSPTAARARTAHVKPRRHPKAHPHRRLLSETPVIDNFNRANETLSDGGKWTNNIASTGETGLKVLSNQLSSSTSTTATAWRNDQRYGPDTEVVVTIATKPNAGNSVRLYARVQTPGSGSYDGYMVRYQENSGTDQVFIERIDASTITTLTTLNQEFAAGDKLKLRVIGNAIQAWRYAGSSWSEVGETSDPRYDAAGYVGVGLRGTTGRLDDFGAASLSPPPTPDPNPVLDDFNRPNEQLSDGGKWRRNIPGAGENGLSVLSNQLYSASTSTATAWWSDQRFGPDQFAAVTIASKPGVGNAVRLYARLRSPGFSSYDGYMLLFSHLASDDQEALYRIDNSGLVFLASWTKEIAGGDELMLRTIGSSIQAWRYSGSTWSEIGETSDQTYQDGGYVGVGLRQVWGRLDDFRGGPAFYLPPGETVGSCGIVAVPTDTGPRIEPSGCENPTACLAEPVNTATGAYTTSVTDLSLAGIGVPFRVTRSYTSIDTTSGPLGPAWTDTYAASLTVHSSGDVLFRAEDGQQLYFTLQSDGSFTAPPGSRLTLSTVTGGYQLVRRDQVVYRFDSSGKLLSIRDRNGQGVTLAYASGRLSTVTDSASRTVSFSYDGSGLLSSVALPDGRHVDYGYTSGRLTSVTDARGGTTSYTYDGSGRLASIVDQNGHTVVQNTYGTDGRVTQQTNARGNTTSFDWNAATQTATVTDARGNAWKDVYSDNILVSRVDPLGDATTFTWDRAFNLTSVTDARGKTTTMTYDGRGNLLTRTAPAPLSYQQSFTYDAQNDLLSYQDGRGHTTTFDYDAAGNLTKETAPGAVVTQFGRDPGGTGLLTSITDPRGKVTSFGHDSAGNLTSITSPLGEQTTLGYDGSGRPTSVVEARGNAQGADPADYRWTYAYNAADALVSVTDPLDHTTATTYDPAGNVVSLTDARDHTTTYAYDAADHLTSVTAPGGSVTSYSYDGDGNVTGRTDANNHTRSYAYDAANRLTSVTTPLGNLWTYAYDADGNPVTLVDANGNATPTAGDGTTTFSYDALSRLTGIDYSDDTPSVSYAYDGNGNRTSMVDGAGTTTYGYDDLDRLTAVTRGADTFGYGYDAAGNVTNRTYPDGASVNSTYDDDRRLASVASGGATTSYGYDQAGNLLQTTLPAANGYVETRTYDRAGRLVSVDNSKDGTALSDYTYTLDPVGDPTTVTGSDGTATYEYDARDRLTSVCYQTSCPGPDDPFIRYSYDDVGNRLSETRPDGTTNYSYNADDELTAAGGTSYTYDADGNETAAGSRSFGYDLANRLVSTTDAGATTTYSYDGDGKRLTATTGTDTTKYLWDVDFGLPELALERDGSGALLRRYLYGNARISMTTGGDTFYYQYDRLGSVVNLTSASGDPEWSYSYEPYGATLTESQDGVDPPTNPMRFAGEQLDADTGLYHLRARQYDPAAGRFLATDPIPQSPLEPAVGAYVYALDLPTAVLDPTGLHCLSPQCVVDYARAGVRAAGRVILKAASRASGTVVGAAGAGCLFFVEAPMLVAACEGLVVTGSALDVAASARQNVFGPCKDIARFIGDAAFAEASVAAGPAARVTWKEILNAEDRKLADRLTDPAIWAVGAARHLGEPTGCNTK
jgi:RHS repeat-associated protein